MYNGSWALDACVGLGTTAMSGFVARYLGCDNEYDLHVQVAETAKLS